jgi:hypothetical protein
MAWPSRSCRSNKNERLKPITPLFSPTRRNELNRGSFHRDVPLMPFPSDRLTLRQVNPVVNNVKNQGPQCLEPPDAS